MANPHDAEVLDATTLISLEELSRASGADEAWVMEMISHGVISPDASGTRYAALSITRIRKARRLEQDFELNAPGVALALDLLDEIDRLRARLAYLR